LFYSSLEEGDPAMDRFLMLLQDDDYEIINNVKVEYITPDGESSEWLYVKYCKYFNHCTRMRHLSVKFKIITARISTGAL